MDRKKLLSAKYLVPAGLCLLVIFEMLYHYLFAAMSVNGKEAKIYIDSDDSLDSVICKLRPVCTSGGISGFSTLALQLGYNENVRPGMYLLDENIGPLSFLRKLRNGRQDFIMLTVPSVRTMPDLARKLGDKMLTDSATFMQAFSDSMKIRKYGFTTETLRAMFLPHTYEVLWTDSADKFMNRMEKEYKKFWTDERKSKAKIKGLSLIEVSTLASIVDSETNIESDKPRVAGVYLNRLHEGMKLQADPTVKFAVGDFSIKRILFKHLSTKSPYNTYRYEGLPPGPICIPSISGIDAVLNAENHDYLFFCASPAFDGTHIFARDDKEHMENARKYQAALNARKIK